VILRHRAREGALLPFAHERPVDGVGERRDGGRVVLGQTRILEQPCERAHQHQGRNALGMVEDESLRHHRTHRVAGDHCRLQVHRVHEREQVPRHVRDEVAGLGPARVAVPAL
jgi:hypothetical protein